MTELIYDCTTNNGIKMTVKTWAEAESIRRNGGDYTKRYRTVERQLWYQCKTNEGVFFAQGLRQALDYRKNGAKITPIYRYV